MHSTLQNFRDQLDTIDQQLLDLLVQRFAITQQVGEYKRDNDVPPIDPEREARQFARFEQHAKEAGLSPKLAQDILRLIIDEVVKNHQALRKDNSDNQSQDKQS